MDIEKKYKFYFFWLYHLGISKQTLSQIKNKLNEKDLVNIYNGHYLDYAISSINFSQRDLQLLSNDTKFKLSKKDARSITQKFNKVGVKVTFFYDYDYPTSLRNIPNPPFVIFTRGNYSILTNKDKLISIAGSRKISDASAEYLRRTVRDLVRGGYGTVSGLALGTDIIANKSTYLANGYTIAVLPGSIFSIIPKSHSVYADDILKKNGLLLSEYYTDHFSKNNYIQRNRIISGLGKCLLLTEFNEHSGTIHTAKFAWLQRKKIFCFSNNSSGVKKLIGLNIATPFRNISDFRWIGGEIND